MEYSAAPKIFTKFISIKVHNVTLNQRFKVNLVECTQIIILFRAEKIQNKDIF